MNRASIVGIFGMAMLAWGLISQIAMSQQKPLREQLVGTWALVSWDQRNVDGTTVQQFGANPMGIAFFDTTGHYIITVMRTDRGKYAIDNFGQIAQATAEENKATAQGTITYFGTYSVNELDRTIAIHVEGSSFPNWNGTDQQRLFEITKDELKLTVRPPRGGSIDVLWKRAK
jgi:lipocalin-like protein